MSDVQAPLVPLRSLVVAQSSAEDIRAAVYAGMDTAIEDLDNKLEALIAEVRELEHRISGILEEL